MSDAEWLNDFVENFINDVAYASFECLIFLGRGPRFDRLDAFDHLAV
jgi:hypothetical protein